MKLTNVCLSIGISTILLLSYVPQASANPFAVWGTRILQGIGVYGTVTDGAEIMDPFISAPKVGGNLVLGSLGHHQYWNFCSSNGYQSYYNRGYNIICGYDKYDKNESNPNGNYFSYDDVCNGYYGNSATFDGQMCISNYVPQE